MFKIDEIVVINFRQFQSWPAKVIDIFYLKNQPSHFDLILFHKSRVRIVLPFQSVSKLDRLTLSRFGQLQTKKQSRSVFDQAWSIAFKQLQQKRQTQLNPHLFQTQQPHRTISSHNKEETPNELVRSMQQKSYKQAKGFVFCHNFQLVTIEQVERQPKALAQQAFNIKFKQASELDLLESVLNFKQRFFCALNTYESENLRKSVEGIADVIKILLLIQNKKTQIILILQSLIEQWKERNNLMIPRS